MNQPVANNPVIDPQSFDPQVMNGQAMNAQVLDLRDIHLPDPVSWWPPAPGWWLLLAGIVLAIIVAMIARKIYNSKQLRRDIRTELDKIKQQYSQAQNKLQLAKSLSVLLRRASISYYPRADIAGLTGDNWLRYLDDSNSGGSKGNRFQSDAGKILLTAPYLPDTGQNSSKVDFDAEQLISLCESWLQSPHNRPLSTREHSV